MRPGFGGVTKASGTAPANGGNNGEFFNQAAIAAVGGAGRPAGGRCLQWRRRGRQYADAGFGARDSNSDPNSDADAESRSDAHANQLRYR